MDRSTLPVLLFSSRAECSTLNVTSPIKHSWCDFLRSWRIRNPGLCCRTDELVIIGPGPAASRSLEESNVKKRQSWRGVFTIPCTPFTETGALDLDSLRSQIEFCVEAGAHGIVAPVIASEVWTLTGEERMSIAEETVEIVAGRIPVVIGVSTGSIQSSLPLTYHAAEIGANAIIATPPVGPASTLPAIYDFYPSSRTPLHCRYSSSISTPHMG